MKRLVILGLVSTLALSFGCGEDEVLTPQSSPDPSLQAGSTVDPEQVARELLERAGWPMAEGMETSVGSNVERRHCIMGFEREVVVGDIAHYSLQVRVGHGPYDVIGVHRVVRERRPYHPIRTSKSIELLHGDIKDFVGVFLPGTTSPAMPNDFGLAVLLAQSDIDVWGIDQAWTLVPAGVSDFSFMADWGLDRQVTDLEVAMEVARVVRWLSGNGYRGMPLFGYSSGAVTGFALLNDESQRPLWQRKVSAFITGDYGMRSDDPDWMAAIGDEYPVLLDAWQSGVYQLDSPFPTFGFPAQNDPDGPTDVIPGLTNLQAAIGLGAWAAYPGTYYHFAGGIFDDDGIPVGFQYTNVDLWIDFMVTGPPYEPIRFLVDYEACVVVPEEVPWDDHLGDIEVPVYYVSAVGGAGEYTSYTLDLLGSTDITRLDVGFHPPEEILLEFAHVDLFIANDAPTLVFVPMRDWIVSHTP